MARSFFCFIWVLETRQIDVSKGTIFKEASLFAFPARASNEDFQALHTFVISGHRVLFGGVHCGLRLINGWRLVLSVIPLLASRQQQGDRGRHCCYRDKGFW